MSSVHSWDVDGPITVLGQSFVAISTATTTAYDFGTPNDIDLQNNSRGRVLVILSADSDGSTDTVSWSIQDADDDSGSIGTPATATTSGTLTGGTGDQSAIASVRVTPGRPWLRVNVTSDGATDTFATHCTVLDLPAGL